MTIPDVRRLAAVDMHGLAGTRLRRRLILAEFTIGAVAALAVGLWVAVRAGSSGWRAFGTWAAGVGLNYVPLTLHAGSLSHKGALEAELAGVDVRRELRRYSYLQLWVLVPLLFPVLALRQRPRQHR